ncbi:hypothetical protein ES703_83626 [subsurface metagenome]
MRLIIVLVAGAAQVVFGVYLALKKKGWRVRWYWLTIAVVVLVSLLLVYPTLEGFWWRVPWGQPVATPSLTIMVESNTVEAGSSFMVCGEFFPPGQKVWAKFEWQASDSKGATGGYSEAEDNGFVSLRIPIPEDIVPGDYEVEVYLGKHLDDRELIATLPIHVEARR